MDRKSYLAPDQHRAEDHLEPVEEVVPDDDDGGPPSGPALTGADGFDAGCSSFRRHKGPHRENERRRVQGPAESHTHTHTHAHTRTLNTYTSVATTIPAVNSKADRGILI